MRPNWVRDWVPVGTVVVIGLCTLPWALAQEQEDSAFSDTALERRAEWEQLGRSAADLKRAEAEVQRAMASQHRRIARMHSEQDSMSAIRRVAEKLRDAENDSARADAAAKLRQMLSEYFDKDMERRASELQQIEKRVSKLREQLERRGSHKPEIIDLQVKVLVNEAEGLGFFSNTESTGFIFGPSGDRFRLSGEMGMPPMPPIGMSPAAGPPPIPPARAEGAEEPFDREPPR